MSKANLTRTDLICVDCYYYGGAVASLKKCMEQCDFNRVMFFTNIPIKIEGVEVIQIPKISSKEQYSQFIIKELWKYIESDYTLICQHDGWVLRGESWSDDFYDYDGIGSAWLYTDGRNNFNGGFCMMSKKLLTVLGTDDFIKIASPDDEIIGRLYRNYLIETHGIKFPDDDTCDRFAFELRCPSKNTFGFHSFFHEPYKPTVLIKRMGACGDVVMVEPVMRYFHDKGYRVVLDTLPQFYLLFLNHDFKIHRVGEVDQRLLVDAKIVNLDMSYESNPKQLHLRSYFEYAGIDEKDFLPYLVSPKLSVGFPVTDEMKLIKGKYAVLNIDNNRAQGGRRYSGISWRKVVDNLIELGYVVVQLGRDNDVLVPNAIQLNCTNENFLCYVCSGASLMVGIDSGIANICAGFNVPCVILFGSVDPMVIHPEWHNKIAVHNHGGAGVCGEHKFCWGSAISTEGVKCKIGEEQLPPCSIFTDSQVINAIKQLHDTIV